MRYYSVITLIFAWVDLGAARTSTLVAILETAAKESLSSRWNRSKLNKYVTLKLLVSHSDIETIILLRTMICYEQLRIFQDASLPEKFSLFQGNLDER